MVRKINGRTITPLDHRAQHQAGGEDEINVGNLKGRLKDPQNADAILGKEVSLQGLAANKILQYDGERFVVGDKAGASGVGDIAADAFWIAKGDLAAGAGTGVGQRLAVGTDPWMQLRPNPARGQGLEWAPPMPDFLTRVLYEPDGAGNTLEIHQVWIPPFVSAGAPQANLNGLELGGFWCDKFQACQPAASRVSRGGLSSDAPGAGVGAACKPHVVPWTDLSWTTAKQVIESRGGEAGKATGACAAAGTGSATQFYVESIEDLIGRRVIVTQNGVDYIRRIVKTGGDADADPGAAKLVELYPALPQSIMEADTYTIQRHYMLGSYEWASLALWAITFRTRFGLGFPKGNCDWGKDVGDPRAPKYEGIPDPVKPGYQGNAIARTLTGSGPLSWSLNGKGSGPMDLVGNVWEWSDLLIGGVADHTVDPGYPGAGHVVPTDGGSIAALYDPIPEDGKSLGADLFVPKTIGSANPDYGSDQYWVSTGPRAALRGGPWFHGVNAGLFTLYLSNAPSHRTYHIGVRGGS